MSVAPVRTPDDQTVPVAPAPTRRVRTLVTLGDSTPVGVGDPAPGGGWRGFPVLLRDALGASELVNPSRTGARMAEVRHRQLPVAVAAGPDAVVLFVGMNDTLRSDFDPGRIRADADAVVTALRGVGAHVLMPRYHDHTRVFRLPRSLQGALRARIESVNAAIDAVAAAHRGWVTVLDLDALPGGYEPDAWAVDRLHPSERGHRLLAAGFARLLGDAGFAVPHPVGLECGGGREITSAHRAAWLLLKGVPWLVRRSRDLVPVVAAALVESRGRATPAVRGRPTTGRRTIAEG